MNPILAAILLTILVWFTGCAGTSWNAGLSADDIDWHSPNPVIPKANLSIGGKF
jgi:hypothetical protein